MIAAHGVMERGDAWSHHVAPSLHHWLPWALVTPLLVRLVFRLPVERGNLLKSIAIHLVLFVTISLGIHILDTARWDTPDRPPPFDDGRHPDFQFRPDGPPPNDRMGRKPEGPPPNGRRSPPSSASFNMFQYVSEDMPIYLAILMFAHAFHYYLREQEKAAILAQARLRALRMQLQPHFLFNTLNAIGGLIMESPGKADDMLGKLSELLRKSLDFSEEETVGLTGELEFVRHYLELMQIRFEERLRYTIEVTGDVQYAKVPVMILQPLVENAVEHGIQIRKEGGGGGFHQSLAFGERFVFIRCQ